MPWPWSLDTMMTFCCLSQRQNPPRITRNLPGMRGDWPFWLLLPFFWGNEGRIAKTGFVSGSGSRFQTSVALLLRLGIGPDSTGNSSRFQTPVAFQNDVIKGWPKSKILPSFCRRKSSSFERLTSCQICLLFRSGGAVLASSASLCRCEKLGTIDSLFLVVA